MDAAVPPIDLTIVVVNWNARAYLRGCLRSIIEQTRESSYEIVVVDNNSTDGSRQMLAAEFPDVIGILNEDNRGFAAANNQALRLARGRYVLLINPDTLVLDGAIDACVAYADELSGERIGVLGCQVWEDADTIQKTCFRFPSPLNILLDMLTCTSRFPQSRSWAARRWVRGIAATSARSTSCRACSCWSGARPWMTLGRWTTGTSCTPRRRTGVTGSGRVAGAACSPRGRGSCTSRAAGGAPSAAPWSARTCYLQLQKSLLRFHRQDRGLRDWALAQAVYAVLMPIRAAVFAVLALVGRREDRRVSCCRR